MRGRRVRDRRPPGVCACRFVHAQVLTWEQLRRRAAVLAIVVPACAWASYALTTHLATALTGGAS